MLFILAMIFLLAGYTHADTPSSSSVSRKTDTWLSPTPAEQIYIEGKDDQKGMGRVFVPVITSAANEPNYAVFQDNVLIGERSMGSSFFLTPGEYTVLLGTGTLEQRMIRQVDIHRGQTVILEPDWCALTIEVIDESRNYDDNVDLQIFRIESLESYGIIPAINPELGEQLQTLLLEPGLYKIVERGKDINTLVNFTTVLLESETYTPFTIVVNSQTGDFTGSGILASYSQLKQRRNLRIFGAIHGSVNLTAKNDGSTRNVKTNFNVLSQVENRILYDKLPHYYLSNNLLELGALRQQGQAFQKSQDRLQIKNTYVYYVMKWLGGYARFEVTTHLFPTIARFKEGKDVILKNFSGNETRKTNIDELQLEPSFFPFGLKQGIGANITPIRTYKVRLNLRTGFGFRQIYNYDVYQLESENVYKRIPNNILRGLETSIVSNISLLRNLAVTTEFDVLFPFGSSEKDPVIYLENIASLGITRNVSIDHNFRLSRIPDLDWVILDQFVSVRISYFIF